MEFNLIMKLIHSFSTNIDDIQNIKEAINSKKWGDSLSKRRVHWYCWVWSFLSASKHSDQFELYTDAMGADILVGALNLPYSRVNLTLDGINKKYMYLGKIKTYAVQREPFLHMDGDVVFREYFPTNLPNLYAQQYSWWLKDLYQNTLVLLFNNNFQAIPEEFKKLNILTMKNSEFGTLNAGVFGGTDLELIRECANKTLLFFENTHNTKLLNDLLDEFSLMTFYANNKKGSTYTQTALFSLFEEFLPVLMYKQKYKNLDGLKTVLNEEDIEKEHTVELNIDRSTELKYVHLMDAKRDDGEQSVAYRQRFIQKFREEYPEWAAKVDTYLS